MTRRTPAQPLRILALALSSRGFGFAVLEADETLANWGVKTVQGDKNARSLEKAGELIRQYQPDMLVLEEVKGSRRSKRIQELTRQMITLAKNYKVKVSLLSKPQVRQTLAGNGPATKDDLARILARRFPEELGERLPPRRQLWMSEDYRMGLFEAAALALTQYLKYTTSAP